MKTALHVKVDSTTKEEAQKIARMIGIPLSSLVNGLLTKFVNDRGVTLYAPYQLRPEIADELVQIDKDIEEGREQLSPTVTGSDEVSKYLTSVLYADDSVHEKV